MEKNADNEYYQNDEIDLYGFWLTLKKRWSVIFIITLISTGLAFSYTFIAPKVYRVHNVLMFNQIQDWDRELFNQTEISAAISVLDKLNKFTDLEKNKVSSILGMHEEDLKDIKTIKTSEIKGSNALWVDIDTYDRNKGVALMENLPIYVLSNPNIANKLKIQKALMQKNREDLKAIIDNPTRTLRLSRDAVVYLPSFDLYTLQERYNRINAIMEKMDKLQLISLAWKTEPPVKPIWPKKNLMLLLGFALGAFIGSIMAFIVESFETSRKAFSTVSE